MFKKNDKDVVFIASGSQIISEDRLLHDIWFPESTDRLLKLIKKYDIPAILLTGDIHQGEIMTYPYSEESKL